MKTLAILMGVLFIFSLNSTVAIAAGAGNAQQQTLQQKLKKIKLKKPELEVAKRPDLIVPAMTFKKVKSGKDSQNNLYWIFNVNISVKNKGNADSGPFKVLLERNVGASGQFIKACQTCEINVSGIKAGKTLTLDSRQFNNANNYNSTFRATADYLNAITESNEKNNRRKEAFNPITISPKVIKKQ